MPFKCLLFDLDGTLIDSRADLANSINLMLETLGCRLLPADQILGFVGEGVRLLVERSLAASVRESPSEPDVLHAVEVFSEFYSVHLLDRTVLYPGVRETLQTLRHLRKAVVTNKSRGFSEQILKGLGLADEFLVVIGGDSTPERKPSAVPLLEAARICGVPSESCLMIGDTKIDVQAGKAADMATCGFAGGFRGRDELIAAGVDYVIESFEELIELVHGS